MGLDDDLCIGGNPIDYGEQARFELNFNPDDQTQLFQLFEAAIVGGGYNFSPDTIRSQIKSGDVEGLKRTQTTYAATNYPGLTELLDSAQARAKANNYGVLLQISGEDYQNDTQIREFLEKYAAAKYVSDLKEIFRPLVGDEKKFASVFRYLKHNAEPAFKTDYPEILKLEEFKEALLVKTVRELDNNHKNYSARQKVDLVRGIGMYLFYKGLKTKEN